MRPHPCARIAGTRCCDRKNGTARLRVMVMSQPSDVTASAASRVLMPAACTRMSGAPKGSAARAARSARPARSLRSQGRAATGPGASAFRLSSASARRATAITRAPARESTSAARRPRPELAPVTQATWPRRSGWAMPVMARSPGDGSEGRPSRTAGPSPRARRARSNVARVAAPRRSSLLGGNPAVREHRGRGPIIDAHLLEDLFEVLVHRPRAERQDRADVAVGLAEAEPVEHLGLAQGQIERLAQQRLVALRAATDQLDQYL